MARSKGRKESGDKWIQHYSSSHKILLVGEGDFSFSACLAKAFGSATNMVATSYDSKEMLRRKHWSSEDHLEELKGLGCMVLHDIDVHVMNQQLILKMMKFDRIVYNFLHAGRDPLLHEWNWQLIEFLINIMVDPASFQWRHKKLASGFFQSAREMLTDGGEVHVSHRNDEPYNRWNLKKLAEKADLVLKERVEFRKSDYPGYHNKRGGGIKSNQSFPLNESFTFKFSLRDCSTMQQSRTSTSGCDELLSYNDSALKLSSSLAFVQRVAVSSQNDALNANFPPELKLFVGNLPFSVDGAELAGLFEQAGAVEEVKVIYDKLTGRSRGFGFVTMSTAAEVEAAAQQFNGYELDGRALRVNFGPPPRKDDLSSRGFWSWGGGRGSFDSANRVYVGNLSWGVDDLALESLFSEQGKVMEAKVVYDRESGRSRGFGFVTYGSTEEVDSAISSLDGVDLKGRAIRVAMAKSRLR